MMIRRSRPRSAGTISYQINNRTELLAVLQSSGSGGAYTVAPGSYGDLTGLTYPSYASPVTLAGSSSVAGDIDFTSGVAGLTIDGFECRSVSIQKSQNVTVRNCYIHGGDYLVNIGDTNKTISNINILNNVIVDAGVDCLRCATGSGNESGKIDGVLIEGNYISGAGNLGVSHPDALQGWGYCNTAVDGVYDLGECGVHNLTIRGNIILGDQYGPQLIFINNECSFTRHIHEQGPVSCVLTKNSGPGSWSTISATMTFARAAVFDRCNWITAAAHTFDAVQQYDVFTVAVTGNAAPNHGLQFVVSLPSEDTGGKIFIRRTNLMHKNILVENNVCVAQTVHGITGVFVDGFTVHNNILFGLCMDIPDALNSCTIIADQVSRNITIEGNEMVKNPSVSISYVGTGSVTNPASLFTQANQRLASHISHHFVNAQRRFAPTADDFQVLGSSALYSHPAAVAYRGRRPASTLYIKPTLTYGLNSLTVTLDAVRITNDAVVAGCTYDWDFGDGTSHGSGQSVSHTYSYQGEYYVTCAVTGAVTQTLRRTVIVLDPLISYLPLTSGLADKGWTQLGWTEINGSPSYSSEGISIGAGRPQVQKSTIGSRIDVGLQELTISIEFKQQSGDAFGIICSTDAFGLSAYNNDLKFSIGGGVGIITAAQNYNDGNWHRLTGTYSSLTGAMNLYIDNAKATATLTKTGEVPTTGNDFTIGYNGAGNDFGGHVRNLVIISGIPTITGDAAKTAIEDFITARQFSGAEPTAENKTISVAHGASTSLDPHTNATGGPWLDQWCSLASTSNGAGIEYGSASDGKVYIDAARASAGSAVLTYRLRNTKLRDTNAATITVTVT